ncbi:MAG TPA: hypothetical protein VMW10_05085 [Alphaproteobacteria bacterium]|nr:hypothetical protein [Alphaproteobacteria bacterium]
MFSDNNGHISAAEANIYNYSCELNRPSFLFKPKLSIDGNMWCALYGDNLQDGVAGFGKSPELAYLNFDKEWSKSIT